jgi:hypothetical protein
MGTGTGTMGMLVIMLQVPRYPDVRASATALPTLPFLFFFYTLQFWKPDTLLYGPYGICLCLMPWLGRDRKLSPLCCVPESRPPAHRQVTALPDRPGVLFARMIIGNSKGRMSRPWPPDSLNSSVLVRDLASGNLLRKEPSSDSSKLPHLFCAGNLAHLIN